MFGIFNDPISNDSVPNDLVEAWGTKALLVRKEKIKTRQASSANKRQGWIDAASYFYSWIERLLQFIVEPGKRVLALRCETGFLLKSVAPSYGLGIDLTQEMISVAMKKEPELHFEVGDPEQIRFSETFDYIIVQNISDTVDALSLLQGAKTACHSRTRLIVYTYNVLWKPFVLFAQWLGWTAEREEQNWLKVKDLENLLRLGGFEVIEVYDTVAVPVYIPIISWMANRIVPLIPFINKCCLMRAVVARVIEQPISVSDISVSVIVPCRNESGNIAHAINRIPEMGAGTEIIFCDDRSTDTTRQEILDAIRDNPERNIKIVEGPGDGKAKNVWTGFRAATSDVLMILDADLTVMPEELPLFLEAIASRRCEFVNGSRLTYPLPKGAMNFCNMLGNEFFSRLFSYLLKQHISDTLCGTKVLWRSDWARIELLLNSWGVEDRWGDYELLFGAARLHLRIQDLPVHYQERKFGYSKMVKVIQNGIRMLSLSCVAFVKLRYGHVFMKGNGYHDGCL